MFERGKGIILRVRPLTETSLIIAWLTADLGRISTVAKGARRAKSPFRGKLDLFHLAEFSFIRSRRSDLHTLQDVNLIQSFPELRKDLGLLQQASYAAALIEQFTETETPLPEQFTLMQDFLNRISSAPPVPFNVLAFETKLLSDAGLGGQAESLSPASRQFLDMAVRESWEVLAGLKPAQLQMTELAHHLEKMILHHLGRVPLTRSYALGLKA